jgi:hypothetical protein
LCIDGATYRIRRKKERPMKKYAYALCVTMLMVMTVGCQTTKATFQIITEPPDAKIYVDGQYLGDGEANVDTGQPEYGYPKQLEVIIRHPEYLTLRTTIQNRLDFARAVPWALFELGIAGFAFYNGYTSSTDWGQALNYSLVIDIALAGYQFLDSFKFRDSYNLPLEDKK